MSGEEFPEVVCVIHLPPLPGSPLNELEVDEITELALLDARAAEEGGADAVIVENYGDVPFPKKANPETIAAMSVVMKEVKKEIGIAVGVNVLRNDAVAALAIAKASGASFVRVNQLFFSSLSPEGWLESCAAEVMRYKRAIRCKAKVFSDVNVKHAHHFASMEEYAENFERSLADAAVVTGTSTGKAVSLEELEFFRSNLSRPVYAGSGVTPEIAKEIGKKNLADGIIVGTYVKMDNRIDSGKVEKIAKEFKAFKKS